MNVFRWKQRKDQDLDVEIQAHLDEAIRDRIARGETPDEARAHALREFGNVGLVKEVTREMWGWSWLEALGQDLRFGLRMLRKNPGFSFIAILTLALGIGASTTIFSFFNGVLLRPLPYAEPERLVVLDEFAVRSGSESLGVSFTNYLDWRAQNQVFTEVGGYHNITFTLTGAGEATELAGAMASHGLFQLLGVAPLLGRTFTPEEDQRGRGNVVILSHGVWQRHFGGDSQIIGRNITFGSSPWQVVGVMPPAFHFPNGVEFWIPLTLSTKGWPRTMHGMGALARLKPGITETQAQSEMSNIARRLAGQYPDSNAGIDVRVSGLRNHLAQDYRRGVWILLGVTGFVLLVACANLANLLLARGAARQRELAVRGALGASRYALARQALSESLLLGALGGVVGAFIAWLGLKLLLAGLQTNLPYWMKFNVDGRVLAFTVAVSLLTSLLFGLTPAWQAARVDLNEALKSGGRGAISGSRPGLRHGLVVGQVALALVLLIGAGLMMRSLSHLYQVRLGFNPDNVLTLRVTVPGINYQGDSGVFFERLLERVNALPGVERAGAIVALPLTGVDDKWDNGFATESQSALALQQAPRISFGMVTQRYFDAMEIPLLAGRAFEAGDTKDTPKVAIIDERLAHTHWPNASPLGQRIRIGQADEPEATHRLVEFSVLATPLDPFDPMERALRTFAREALEGTEHLHGDWRPKRAYALTPDILAMTHVYGLEGPGRHLLATKGAPEAILDLCHLGPEERSRALARAEILAAGGLRVLGVAMGTHLDEGLPESQHDFTFELLGFVALEDPLRPEVGAAVASCRAAGIRVLMMTGDHPATALAIARQLGLSTEAPPLLGEELASLPEPELKRRLASASVCARLRPEQKERLVRTLQSLGEVVAMTGDGVNDAPGLRAAHVGVAMGTRGTDVARETADLVLVDDSFARLAEGVRMGRRVYDNLARSVRFVYAVHLPVLGLILVPLVLKWPAPLLPLHLVLLHMLIDPACSLVLEAEPEAPDLMARPPRDPGATPFGARALGRGALLGLGVLAVLLGLVAWGMGAGWSPEAVRGALLPALFASAFLLVLAARGSGPLRALTVPNARVGVMALGLGLVLGLILAVRPLRAVLQLAPLEGSSLAASGAALLGVLIWLEVSALGTGRPGADTQREGPRGR